MSNDTTIIVYYGPLSWFEEEIGTEQSDSLLEIVYAREEERRQLRVVIPDQPEAELNSWESDSPDRVVADSSDYASLNEHVITNFAGLIHSIKPKHLFLHNPPVHVHIQLQRHFPSMSVERYIYPAVTRETLIEFRDGFESHLIGQRAVKETLLAALYPLTAQRRSQPVVLMFYGPSGVGKTETAQFINSLLGGTLLRKQFSMFHNDNFASYLFGGNHSEPSFAHDLLDRESGVILIDEFDKANSIFHSAFYQLFDGGVFEDKNYRVQLGPSLIICTSNYSSEGQIREALGDALYSRFDSLMGFQALSIDETRQVIDRIFSRYVSELTVEEQGLLNIENLKTILHPLANDSTNVRRIGKLIKEVISLSLVRSILGNHPSER
ncbi:hypothetical protein Kisp01_69530 [Kineosporia sp. NBRC 101677]|uniref:AAA family ATPase n=1 Tax=Kineosporia sp. NBRC 101677 TaxID=3032197 RepID=UPI0024A5B598|nr:AAA family ATPase [Kineosporia sp. NBRC 101677]GLY19939.1 hypothetical protein Kisp01_69530 [Kineosporia sp. NBRC 101677]